MAERSTVAEVTQIGVEATPGTGVVATKRLASLSLSMSPDLSVDSFTPAGSKNVTVTALNTEQAALDLSGQPTYDEIIYPLAACFGTPTTTLVMDGATSTLSYDWVFTPNALGTDTPKTLTIEQGQTVRAQRATYGILTDFGMDISRSAVSCSGSGFAQALTDGVTLTAGVPQTTSLVPILPGQFSAYFGTTPPTGTTPSGGLTQITRLISANPSIGSRFNPAWFLNAAIQSFTAVVETPNDATVECVFEADAYGMGFLSQLRSGQVGYLRLAAGGPNIYTGTGGTPLISNYEFVWDFAVKVNDGGGQDDADGIYGVTWSFAVVHDGTWGKSHTVRVRNKAATL